MAGFVDLLKLVVDADVKGAVSEFKKLEGTAGSSLDGVERKSSSFGSKLSGGFSAIGSSLASSLGPAAIAGTVGAGIGIAINAASDLNEQMSKTQSVFGTSAGEITKWADGAATAFGQSKTQALEAASSFGNMFLQLGLTSGAAVDMSTSMTELASDFASFFNTDPAQALDAIQSAFRGEFDAVQRFVPTINAAAVQQEVLKEGLAKSTKEITEQDKAVATYHLILQNAGKATGDFARTSDGLANQQRILKAQLSDTAAEIGNSLLPALAKIAQTANDAIGWLNSLGKSVQDLDQKSGKGQGGLLGKLTGNKGFDSKSWSEFFGFADKAKDVPPHIDAITNSVDQLNKSAGPAATSVGDFGRNVEDHFRGAASSTDILTQSLSAMGKELGPAGAAFGDLTRNTSTVVQSLDMVPTSADAAANAVSRTGSEFGDLEKKADDLKAAIDDVHTALDNVISNKLDTAGLEKDFIDAAAAADEVEKKVKKGKATQLDANVAYDDAAKKILELAENHRQLAVDAGAADGGQEAFNATLEYARNNVVPPLQQRIDDMIGSYKDFGQQHPKPPLDADPTLAKAKLADAQRAADEFDKKRPKPILSADDQATPKITPVQAALNNISKHYTSTIDVGVNTGSANAALDALRNRLNSAAGQGVLINGRSNLHLTFAQGGLVPGYRNQPQFAMVHGGEYVIPSGLVEAIRKGRPPSGPSAMPKAVTTGSGQSVVINVNGAIDPYNTARQIQTILARGGYVGFSAKAA